ncbi:hypothetical protein ACFYTF_14970 [Nocardia thailandica]|uniref:Uncharacterized protein n=1 Tax=Nocardia thailandica TaxID=257275 RepID=A0ABW6PP04_9NOCA
MALHGEWKPLMAAIEKARWNYRPCKHGIFVYPPDPAAGPITLAGTPGSSRSVRNTRAALRRAGLAGV